MYFSPTGLWNVPTRTGLGVNGVWIETESMQITDMTEKYHSHTILKPAEDGDVHMQLLCMRVAVIIFCY